MKAAPKGINGFLEDFALLRLDSREANIFRGHASSKEYRLESSVERNLEHYRLEHKILREATSSFPTEFESDLTMLERMVRAQHFGVPTRLLDMTWNPLVAAYFAAIDRPRSRGEVLVFSMKKDSLHYADSDAVSCVANIANLSNEEKAELEHNVIIFSSSKDISGFNDLSIVKRLVSFIRVEKPYFSELINPLELNRTYFIKPKLNNNRIIAQSGLFAMSGINGFQIDDSVKLKRLIIPPSQKESLKNALYTLNIHRSNLFPELENARDFILSRLI